MPSCHSQRRWLSTLWVSSPRAVLALPLDAPLRPLVERDSVSHRRGCCIEATLFQMPESFHLIKNPRFQKLEEQIEVECTEEFYKLLRGLDGDEHIDMYLSYIIDGALEAIYNRIFRACLP